MWESVFSQPLDDANPGGPQAPDRKTHLENVETKHVRNHESRLLDISTPKKRGGKFHHWKKGSPEKALKHRKRSLSSVDPR